MQNYICSSCGNSYEAAPDGAGMIVCAFCGWEMNAKNAEKPLEAGTRIEGYEILRHLGSGGSGNVYLAEQTLMERKVALKLVKKEGMSPAEVERFFAEARNIAMFDDPHMISVLDMGTSGDGYCYLATRYVEGETLEVLLGREHFIGQVRALKIVIEVASALGNVWDKTKMFHRDIKPGNIMLTPAGDVMILDMGSAQAYGENSLINGEVEGSPYYMSPEQARGENLFWSTDLYSLGVTLYQMLTGMYPYDAPTVGEILEMHNSRPFPEIASRVPHIKVSAEVELLLKRMMGKTPAERFTSWNEFIAAAKTVLHGLKDKVPEWEKTLVQPPKSTAETDGQKNCMVFFRRQIWSMTFLAVLLICVLSAGFFLYLAGRKNSYYAARCLQEASEVIQQKDWKSSELEEVLDDFRPVMDRFGVDPSVRRRFALYAEEAQNRRTLEKSEQTLLEQLDLQIAQLLEDIRKDLEQCRYNPVLSGRNGKNAGYSKVFRKLYACRNTVKRTSILLPDNLKRKKQLMRRINIALSSVYREFRQICIIPAKKQHQAAASVRKKTDNVKKAAAVPRQRVLADKRAAQKVLPSKKRTVRSVRKEIPQAKQKVLVLKKHQKVLLEKILDLPEDVRNSAANPLLRQLRHVRTEDAYWRALMRSLLHQSRSFYARIYNSGKNFTNEEIRVGSLNKILKIWTIRKDRIYFRNEPVVQTFNQIYSGDWYDFLKRMAAKEKAQKDFEAYLLFTRNYFVLDPGKMRNGQARRLLPCVRALRSEIRSRVRK